MHRTKQDLQYGWYDDFQYYCSKSRIKQKVYDYRESQAVFFCNMAGYKGCEIAYNDCEDWLEELLPILDHNRQVVEPSWQKTSHRSR